MDSHVARTSVVFFCVLSGCVLAGGDAVDPELDNPDRQTQAVTTCPTPSSPNQYSASADFSTIQSCRQWSYLDSTGAKMTFDAPNNQWKGKETYLALWASGGHPGNRADAVRRWTAPSAGSIHITGNARDLDTRCGAGVVATIKKGATILWQQTIANGNTTGFGFDVPTSVASGENVDFVINKGAGNWDCDGTAFDPKIALTPDVPTPPPPPSDKGSIFWTDGMESTASPFHYAPHFAAGIYTLDTDIKHSGTASIRVNYPANCQNTISEGQCGGAISRQFPAPTANSYRRAWFRMSGDSDKGAPNGTPGGTFQTYRTAYTKMFENVATSSPGPNHFARTWVTMGQDGGKLLNIGAEHVPAIGNATKYNTSISLQDNQWYCIEVHEQMNDVGVANGVIEIWVDDANVLTSTNVLFRNNGTDANSKWRELQFFRQGGGPGNIWWDDVAAGDQRLGCMATATPPGL